MYPKYKTEQVIEKYADPMRRLLGLERWTIEYIVINSNSESLKRIKLHKWDYTDKYAITYRGCGSKVATIVIYYNTLSSHNEAIKTLWHELLHCAFSALADCVTIQTDKAHKEEELLIQKLENVILGSTMLKNLMKDKRRS